MLGHNSIYLDRESFLCSKCVLFSDGHETAGGRLDLLPWSFWPPPHLQEILTTKQARLSQRSSGRWKLPVTYPAALAYTSPGAGRRPGGLPWLWLHLQQLPNTKEWTAGLQDSSSSSSRGGWRTVILWPAVSCKVRNFSSLPFVIL
mgnify:CR=1 FL=1